MENKKLIILSGNSCGGKTTTARVLNQIIKDSYHVSYDKLKWGFFDYKKEDHKDIVQQLPHALISFLLKHNVCIISEMFFLNEEEWLTFKCEVINKGYVIHFFKFFANQDILLERFKRRIRTGVKDGGLKISTPNETIFLKGTDYKYFCPKEAIEIDTSGISENEVVELIMKTI